MITTYHVTRLDMDVEATSLTSTAGISRRNQAIKLRGRGRRTAFCRCGSQYTIPVAAEPA